jgi:putative nucleotidyltransferase with HDIG domain
MPLTAPQAIELLLTHMQNENLRRHCMAVGFVMRALAGKLGGDPDVWETLGILHDADWEETKDTPDIHTKHTLAWLKEKGMTDGPVVHALMSHNTKHTHLAELDGKMEWALETCDELTGFIVAVALVRPDKQLATVSLHSVMKKWKTKEFAKAVDRSQIAQCEEKLGTPLNEFIEITLKAMQDHHAELGL